MSARIQAILTDLDRHRRSTSNEPHALDDDITTATESELFAILDEDFGPNAVTS